MVHRFRVIVIFGSIDCSSVESFVYFHKYESGSCDDSSNLSLSPSSSSKPAQPTMAAMM